MKKWGVILAGVLVIVFAVNSVPLLKPVRYSLVEKENAAVFLKEISRDMKPFNISFNVPANEDAGFRYLLSYYRVAYSGNPKDPLIQFVIPSDKLPTPFVFGGIGVYLPK